MRGFMMRLLILCCLTGVAAAQDFPLWAQFLKKHSASTDETPVPSMKMENHMQMSSKGAAEPSDEARAQAIVIAAREVLARYHDMDTAMNDGYRPFAPTGKMGEEVHYTSYRYHKQEQQHVDYRQPGSILYRRTPQGMKAVGVMYTAPAESTPEQLNAIAPLSIATWHRHVDFCVGPRSVGLKQQFGKDSQFGPQGSVHTEQACAKAQGLWIPVVFGWMTHVYPDAKEIWAGMDMHMESNSDTIK
jgi:hypothetical protein